MSRAWWLVLWVLLLSACAVVPPQPVDRALVDELERWSIRGRLAVRDNGDNWYGSLRWKQAGEDYRIDLSGPLGQGSLRIEEAGGDALLQVTTERVYRSPDMEALLRRHLGWYLPVRGMRYWIKGLPAPGLASLIERDLLGALTTLHQNGWEITYDRYRPVDGLVLPHRIKLVSGVLRVRLVIDSWETVVARDEAT